MNSVIEREHRGGDASVAAPVRILPFALATSALIAVVLAHASLTPTFAPGAFHDDGVYLVLGKSIAAGEGYRSLYEPGAPIHVKYPPGVPLLFALLWAAAGSLGAVVHAAFYSAIAAAAAAAALLVTLAMKHGVSGWLAAPAIATAFVLDANITYFTLPISEPYFVLLWALILVLACDVGEAGRAAALGLAIAAATLVRAQAVVFVPALLCALLLERSTRAAIVAFVAAALVPIIAWKGVHAALIAGGSVSTAPDELSYVDWVQTEGMASTLKLLARAVASNSVQYMLHALHTLSWFTPLAVVLLAATAALIARGGWLLLRSAPAVPLTLGATLFIIVLWPFAQDRLLLSTAPVAALCAVYALGRMHRPRLAVRCALLCACTLPVLAQQVKLRAQLDAHGPPRMFIPEYALVYNSRYIRNTAEWLVRYSAPEARVLADFPAAVHLGSGRLVRAANPTESNLVRTRVFATPGAYLRHRALEDRIDYVVDSGPDEGMQRDIATVLREDSGALERQDAHGIVPLPPIYRIHRERLRRSRLAAPLRGRASL